MRRRLLAVVLAAGTLAAVSSVASAHVHHVFNPNHGQQIANGQNHPGFVLRADGLLHSCEGINEPANSGPAWYGTEVAHHGPDLGTPGRGDGCYANVPDPANPIRPPDGNPAID